jgi:hypothetical protein
MEEWLLMQSFYHGLTHKSHEQLNAAAGGSFMSLTLKKAKVLMERIASNQAWSSCNIQSCNKSEEVPEEVCALSTKMDILLNWLKQRDNYKRDRQAIQDAFNAQNRCEEYLGVEFPKSQEDINIVINNSTQSNRGKDGINNHSQLTKVSTKVITIILPILNNHP